MSWDNPRTPLRQGIVIVLEEIDREVIVPMLTLGQREDHEELIDKIMSSRPTPDLPAIATQDEIDAHRRIRRAAEMEAMGTLRAIVQLALSRNYPEIEDKDLRDFTMPDLQRALQFALAGPAANVGEVRTASRNLSLANGTAVGHAA